MKIKIMNNKGVEVAIKPESVLVNGKLLTEWLDDITALKSELKNIQNENNKLAKQLKAFWEEIK